MRHLGGVITCIYFSRMCFNTFAYTSVPFRSPSSLGLHSLQLLSPKIWRSWCYKLKNDPDDATQKNKPASFTIRGPSLALYLQPKPATHPKYFKHRRRSRAHILRRHPRSRVATPSQQQRFHHGSMIKPKCRRCQLNPNQRRRHTLIASASTVTPHVSKPHDYVNHMFKRP
jgi:hypothetical protein